MAETHPLLRDRIGEMFDDLSERLAPLFVAITRRPQIEHDDRPDAEELARTFVALIEGSIVLARAKDDPGEIRAGLRSFRSYLELIAQQTN